MWDWGGNQALDLLSLQERLWGFSSCRCLMPAVRIGCWEAHEEEKASWTNQWARRGVGLISKRKQYRAKQTKKWILVWLGKNWPFSATSVNGFFPVVSPKRVSAGNSDAKGAYLGWLRNILASGSSLVLRAWVLGAPVRCKPRLHSSTTVSATCQTVSCSEDQLPNVEKIPAAAQRQQSAEPSAWVKAGMVLHIIL